MSKAIKQLFTLHVSRIVAKNFPLLASPEQKAYA